MPLFPSQLLNTYTSVSSPLTNNMLCGPWGKQKNAVLLPQMWMNATVVRTLAVMISFVITTGEVITASAASQGIASSTSDVQVRTNWKPLPYDPFAVTQVPSDLNLLENLRTDQCPTHEILTWVLMIYILPFFFGEFIPILDQYCTILPTLDLWMLGLGRVGLGLRHSKL